MNTGVSQWGDARRGKLADNLVGFGRTLRRAGFPVDSQRMALASQALMAVGVDDKSDVSHALEAVLVNDVAQRLVFHELFNAYFKDPEVANKLLAQLLPKSAGQSDNTQRMRTQDALRPPAPAQSESREKKEEEVRFDAAMTASQIKRLHQADFNTLSASEYSLVQALVRDIALPFPKVAARRYVPKRHAAQLDWSRMAASTARLGGECVQLPHMGRAQEVLPLMVLVDVSGSMERYVRMLLAYLHAALRRGAARGRAWRVGRRDVMAFGTQLNDLSEAFALPDTDDMLDAVQDQVKDFAGGTRLGDSLVELRRQYAKRLIGRRTVVLLISDGLDTGRAQDLDKELAWLKRHSRKLLWLNPLLRFDQYQPAAAGARVLNQHADGVVAIHNVDHLRDLARSVERILKEG
jgi:uncharacterized protein with von Willebrand factor type A (vWA) domain